ncbi:GGDEF domain-containing protein [Halopseudomonas phragmitis]|uniref:diguanylate cyclase n=1 Tax=Halopseudomonas phragmitis TaxID=1931241 RepID=A0A1V0B3P1_9GAMM|nr:GGDEF domain-containing protein [Halopseudomonas phragmitis]AQZ94547.1 hypothetical protein BVH74_07170 [Halopseudomonas phragmitis]
MEHTETGQQHFRSVRRALLVLIFFCGLYFGLSNTAHGARLLGALELFYAGFALLMLWIAERTRYLRAWLLAFLIPFFMIMILAMTLPSSSRTIFAWIQAVPIISYMLLGLKAGFWMTLGFVPLGVLAFKYRLLMEGEPRVFIALTNLAVSSLAIAILAHVYERSRTENEKRLSEQARTDPLTGLANRFKLREVFERETAHAMRNGSPLSLIMLDIDHFKRINDTFGHDIGDQALCHLAALLAEPRREVDLPCRLGGEEFAILLPGASLVAATELADKLREQLQDRPLPLADQDLGFSFSAGVATLGDDGDDLDALLQSADWRMYQAKHQGRNQVVASGRQAPEMESMDG